LSHGSPNQKINSEAEFHMRTIVPFLTACLVAGLAPVPGLFLEPGTDTQAFPGWPGQLDGVPLRPLAPTALDARFEDEFPGRIGRFTCSNRVVILRWVSRPTRALHRAEVCFMGVGYRITPRPVFIDADGNHWSAFTAVRGTETLTVRTRVHDTHGASWPDISSWYWAASLRRTPGPWWAVTIAAPAAIDPGSPPRPSPSKRMESGGPPPEEHRSLRT